MYYTLIINKKDHRNKQRKKFSNQLLLHDLKLPLPVYVITIIFSSTIQTRRELRRGKFLGYKVLNIRLLFSRAQRFSSYVRHLVCQEIPGSHGKTPSVYQNEKATLPQLSVRGARSCLRQREISRHMTQDVRFWETSPPKFNVATK